MVQVDSRLQYEDMLTRIDDDDDDDDEYDDDDDDDDNDAAISYGSRRSVGSRHRQSDIGNGRKTGLPQPKEAKKGRYIPPCSSKSTNVASRNTGVSPPTRTWCQRAWKQRTTSKSGIAVSCRATEPRKAVSWSCYTNLLKSHRIDSKKPGQRSQKRLERGSTTTNGFRIRTFNSPSSTSGTITVLSQVDIILARKKSNTTPHRMPMYLASEQSGERRRPWGGATARRLSCCGVE
jgi:hypothetical protein